MTGKKAATIPGGALMGDERARRRPSFAKKNKAFQMLQRDMEQVTCGRKYCGKPHFWAEICQDIQISRFQAKGFSESRV